MARLLRKIPEENQVEVPLTRPDEHELLERQEKARSALLAWANQAGVQLEQDQLGQIISAPFEQVMLGNGMRLVWKIEQPLSATETRVIERTREKGDRLIVELSKYGRIVADIHAEGAKRICIGLKQNHGYIGTIDEWLGSTVRFQKFLRHQRALIECQRIITETYGAQHIRFFIESFSHLDHEMAEDIEIILENGRAFYDGKERELELAENDVASAKQLCDKVGQLKASSDVASVKQYFALLQGSRRYVTSMIAQGRITPDHLHGHMTVDWSSDVLGRMPELCNQQDSDDAAFDRLIDEKLACICREQFEQEHPHLTSRINSLSLSDETIVIILGGNHFASGSNTLQGMELDRHRLEMYLLKEPSFRNTRLMVIEPLHSY